MLLTCFTLSVSHVSMFSGSHVAVMFLLSVSHVSMFLGSHVAVMFHTSMLSFPSPNYSTLLISYSELSSLPLLLAQRVTSSCLFVTVLFAIICNITKLISWSTWHFRPHMPKGSTYKFFSFFMSLAVPNFVLPFRNSSAFEWRLETSNILPCWMSITNFATVHQLLMSLAYSAEWCVHLLIYGTKKCTVYCHIYAIFSP